MNMQVAVIDYGAGNMYSIVRGLQRVGMDPAVVTEPKSLRDAGAVVIPGVGHFTQASHQISPYRCALEDLRREGRPILGICLGMQVFLDWSEEGIGRGLGLIAGSVRRFPSGCKVPHMGWNTVHSQWEDPLWEGLPYAPHFYFVHSYFAAPQDMSSVLAFTDYGLNFPSIIAKDSLYGVQFHPEKSGEAGNILLRNFRNLLVR